MYILTKGQRLEWHMYLLTDQFDQSGLFDQINGNNLKTSKKWKLQGSWNGTIVLQDVRNTIRF
jgi:hypothetical protein